MEHVHVAEGQAGLFGRQTTMSSPVIASWARNVQRNDAIEPGPAAPPVSFGFGPRRLACAFVGRAAIAGQTLEFGLYVNVEFALRRRLTFAVFAATSARRVRLRGGTLRRPCAGFAAVRKNR